MPSKNQDGIRLHTCWEKRVFITPSRNSISTFSFGQLYVPTCPCSSSFAFQKVCWDSHPEHQLSSHHSLVAIVDACVSLSGEVPGKDLLDTMIFLVLVQLAHVGPLFGCLAMMHTGAYCHSGGNMLERE